MCINQKRPTKETHKWLGKNQRVAHKRPAQETNAMDGSIDWCCFYYSIRNSLVALMEALFSLLHFSRHHWHAVTLPGKGCAPKLCEGVPPDYWCPVDPAALVHCWRTVPDGNALANRSLPDYCRVAAAASSDTVRSRRPWSTLSGSWHALPDVLVCAELQCPKKRAVWKRGHPLQLPPLRVRPLAQFLLGAARSCSSRGLGHSFHSWPLLCPLCVIWQEYHPTHPFPLRYQHTVNSKNSIKLDFWWIHRVNVVHSKAKNIDKRDVWWLREMSCHDEKNWPNKHQLRAR